MDPKTVHKLEMAFEKPTLDVICRLGLKKLPILLSDDTVQKLFASTCSGSIRLQ
jgi:hypothetical protein